MFSVTPKLEGLTPYQPVEGTYALRLDANESFLDLPHRLKNQISRRIMEVSANRYPDPAASDLCKAFADFYGIDPSLVTAGNGSDELISVIVNCFLGRGETLLTLDPDFSMYPFYAYLAEAHHIPFPKGPGLFLTADAIIEVCKQYNPRMLLFSNPCNPTSLGLVREDVRRIIQSTDALVVLDEAYMDFWNQTLLGEAEQYENLIILRTLSKVGLAAFRLGFAVANPRLTNLLKAAKSPYNLNMLSQVAGQTVLESPEILRDAIAKIRNEKENLLQSLITLQHNHHGRFTVFDSKTNFVTLLMENPATLRDELRSRSISVGLPLGKYLRITAGSEEENRMFLSAFEAWLQNK